MNCVTSGSSVLIVDQSSENREVLRTVLQRQGCEIYEADGDRHGLSLAQKHQPKVVVLDLDSLNLEDTTVLAEFDQHAKKENASVVLLGRVPKSNPAPANSNVVAKPYHYAPLIRKIEELLRLAEPTNEPGRSLDLD
jgi:CheY-like chemotaxis protein